MQALAAFGNSIKSVSEKTSKNLILNEICVFLETDDKNMLFQHVFALTSEMVMTCDRCDTSFTRHNYVEIAPQIPCLIWCISIFHCILHSIDSIALHTFLFVWTRRSVFFM